MPRFKQMPLNPDQVMLFPVSVDAALPADSDVRAISEVMDLLDWSKILSSYSEEGCPAYPPQVMTRILVYAYSSGVRSSRKIEALVENDKRYIWLAGGLTPDFHTLARFRRDKWEYLVSLFEDTARLCREAGLVKLDLVAIDGSKVPGAASRRSVYDGKRIERERAAIERVLSEAEQVDHEEDERYGSSNGRELPKELADAKERKKRLERAAELLRESKREKVSVTDPDSRRMKTRWGIRNGYNLQAAVDVASQVVVAMDVIQEETDSGQLMPMIQKVKQTVGEAPKLSVADSGYCDEDTLLALESSEINALFPVQEPTNEHHEELFRNECFIHDEDRDVLICPAGRELAFKRFNKKGSGTYRIYAAKGCQSCSFYLQCAGGKSSRRISRSIVYGMRRKMQERMKSPQGGEQYSLRRQSVEPVFGQVKSNRGFGRLLLFGLNGAKAECALVFIAHNVLKCTKMLKKTAIKPLKMQRAAIGFVHGQEIALAA